MKQLGFAPGALVSAELFKSPSLIVDRVRMEASLINFRFDHFKKLKSFSLPNVAANNIGKLVLAS